MAELTGYDEAIPLKSALEELLGVDEWYRLKDSRDLKTWKRSLLRALNASKVAITVTVEVADDEWRAGVAEILERGKGDVARSQSFRELLSSFAACYLRLSFHQLGLAPQRKSRPGRISAIPSNWRLNAYRSVLYTQTEEQKMRLQYSRDSRTVSEKALDPKYRGLR